MLVGRVAVVTGATGGLGPAVVQALFDAGATVVATARSAEKLARLQEGLAVPESRWMAFPADLAELATASALVDAVVERFGALHILAALAGGWQGGKVVAESDPELLEELMRLNVKTAFVSCRAALPVMLAQNWGRIVTIGSRSATTGQAKSAAYAASKAALLALTQTIAAETRSTGITANTLLISTMDTEGNRASMPQVDPARWVAPENVAATLTYLCSDEARDISGAAIPIYGRA